MEGKKRCRLHMAFWCLFWLCKVFVQVCCKLMTLNYCLIYTKNMFSSKQSSFHFNQQFQTTIQCSGKMNVQTVDMLSHFWISFSPLAFEHASERVNFGYWQMLGSLHVKESINILPSCCVLPVSTDFRVDSSVNAVQINSLLSRSTSQNPILNVHPLQFFTHLCPFSQWSNSGHFQVKRLMTDPPELCCPISHALMEDPVVAGDGFTYERSCIEGDWVHKMVSMTNDIGSWKRWENLMTSTSTLKKNNDLHIVLLKGKKQVGWSTCKHIWKFWFEGILNIQLSQVPNCYGPFSSHTDACRRLSLLA